MRWLLALIAIQIGCLSGSSQEPRRTGPAILELGDFFTAVAFSPDGGTVYGGGGTPRVPVVRAWDSATGKGVRDFRGQELPVSSLAVSPDGSLLATAPFTMMMVGATSIHLWEAASGKLVGKLAGHEESIHSVAFSPDGARLVSGGVDRTIRLWDVSGRKQVAAWTSEFGVTRVAFLPGGTSVVFGALNGTIRVWDSATGKETASGKAHAGAVVGLAVSADGRRVASVGEDGVLRVAELASLKDGLALKGSEAKIRHTAMSADGRFVASVGDDGLRIWELASLKEAFRIETARLPAAFSPDGRRLATGKTLLDGYVWGLEALATANPPPDAGKALAERDATSAYRAAWGLILQGDAAVAALKPRLLSSPAADVVAKAFARLDDDDIAVREAAYQDLLGYGPAVEGEVRVRLLGNPPEQLRRPLEELRARMNGPVAGWPYLVHRSRSLFVLETIGSPSAVQLLEELAHNGKSALERTEAAAALQRLKKR